MELFDPIKRSEEVEAIVMKGPARAYYRFRFARFYGGIITADAIGCNLLCAYCWSFQKNLSPEGQGEFYRPSEVALKLRKLSRSNDCDQYRISGSEPFLGEASAKHIERIINVVGGSWVIETNGLIIGYQPKILDLFKNLDIFWRVTIKGHNKEIFEKVTGAKGEFFKYPLQAIDELKARGLRLQVAYNPEFVRLNLPRIDVEHEKLHTYSGVAARMKARGLRGGDKPEKAEGRRERPKRAPRQTALNCDEGMYQDLT